MPANGQDRLGFDSPFVIRHPVADFGIEQIINTCQPSQTLQSCGDGDILKLNWNSRVGNNADQTCIYRIYNLIYVGDSRDGSDWVFKQGKVVFLKYLRESLLGG